MSTHDDTSRAASPTIGPSRSHSPDFQQPGKDSEKHADSIDDNGIEYPQGLKLFLISLALCLSVFLVALVRLVHQSLVNVHLMTSTGQYYNR
jgi:hypothetical protein